MASYIVPSLIVAASIVVGSCCHAFIVSRAMPRYQVSTGRVALALDSVTGEMRCIEFENSKRVSQYGPSYQFQEAPTTTTVRQ